MKQSPPPALAHLEEELRSLERRGLLRTRAAPVADVSRSFCSNDYLGLAGEDGSGASRLVVGERPEHALLEQRLAAWLQAESALAFTSGYAANVGALSSLASRGDLVVSDALNHASIIDGCRLSHARVAVVPHADLDAIDCALRERREARAWVVTESYFSMDADGPSLAPLRAICDARGAALVVDEAHALGVFGPAGRGLCAEAAVVPDVLIGTLGKAFGAAGAFVAGCRPLTDWLWNRARSFVFSTGMSAAVARTAAARVDEVARADEARVRLARHAEHLRALLREHRVVAAGRGPILPILLGSPERAMTAAAELRRRGIHVQAIRPPTVPEGTARLRLTLTAAHDADDLGRLERALVECVPWLRASS